MTGTRTWQDDADVAAAQGGGEDEPDDGGVVSADEVLMERGAWQGRDLGWEELVELARSLGPDPELRAVSDAELDRRVRVQAAQLAASTCRWLGLVAELVVRGVWADQGAKTPAQWLSWAVGLAPSTARDHVRVALQLRKLPLLRERFAAGRISYSKVRALTRIAVPKIEPMLLKWADAATASEIEGIVSGFSRTQRGKLTSPEEREHHRSVLQRPAADGLVDVVVRVLPEEAAEIRSLLDRLVQLERAAAGPAAADEGQPRLRLVQGDADEQDQAVPAAVEGPIATSPPYGSQLVDAMLHALVSAVAAGPADTSGADRHTMIVHTELDDLVEPELDGSEPVVVPIEDGQGRSRGMDRRVLRRLACEAGLVFVARDGDGTPMDLGRRDRRLSTALRRALLVRDRSCRFPGCGSVRHLHAHHVHHWADGGPTDLANLVLLCSTHHRFVHEHGWTVRPTGTGEFVFAPPGARSLPRSCPLPDPRSADPGERLDVSAIDGRDHLRPGTWAGPRQADLDLVVAVLDQELRRVLPQAVTAA